MNQKTYIERLKGLEWKTVSIIGILGIAIFIIAIQNLGDLNQIVTINDEFGYWGCGAYLAGYDWTGLTPTSPYYGYGIGIIYMFLFKIFNDSITMYKAAICINGMFLVVSFFLSIYCFKRIFPKIESMYCILFCFLVSLYPNTIAQSQMAWTETLLYFWFWICCVILINIIEKGSPFRMIIFGIWLFYGLMIHQRTLGVVCSGIFIVLLMKITKKIDWKSFVIFLITIFIMFILTYIIKIYFNDNFWLTLDKGMQAGNNMSGQISKIKYIFSLQGIVEFFYSIVGKALYLILSSVMIILAYCMYSMKKIFDNIVFCYKTKTLNLESVNWTLIYVFCAFASTFVISAIYMIGIGTRGDSLLYGRYNEFLIGPLMIIGLGAIYEASSRWKKIGYAIGITLACSFVINYVVNSVNFSAFYVTNIVGIGNYFNDLSVIGNAVYSVTVKVLLLALFVTFLIEQKRFKKVTYIVCTFLIVYEFWVPAAEYNINNTLQLQELFSQNTKDISDAITDEDNEIIYVVNDDNPELLKLDLYDRNIKYIQFYTYNTKIEYKKKSELRDHLLDKTYYIMRKETNSIQDIGDGYSLVYENDMYYLFTKI